MSPEERALHETQVSLERQKRQLDLRHHREAVHGSRGGPGQPLQVLATGCAKGLRPLGQLRERRPQLDELFPPLLLKNPS